MQEIREPAVAGRFYPGDPAILRRDVGRYLGPPPAAGELRVQAALVPHAGYLYSGAIAGETYGRIRVPPRAIVLCPNHTGLGARRSVTAADAWQLPGGPVPVDAELRDELVRRAGLELDHRAHLREHAIEVQLPFLRAKAPDVSFVGVCLGGLSLAECCRLGEGIADAVRAVSPGDPSEVLLVASSDMSHYVSATAAARLDALALERVVALDPEGLYRVVQEHDISMCGYIPTTVALVAARSLGATSARAIRYGNSGEASGDMDRVVGYAGVIVY
jgi:AmmeMemoRadiSam system protein B